MAVIKYTCKECGASAIACPDDPRHTSSKTAWAWAESRGWRLLPFEGGLAIFCPECRKKHGVSK